MAAASDVFPTPASPSRNSGRPSRRAMKSDTARPRSLTYRCSASRCWSSVIDTGAAGTVAGTFAGSLTSGEGRPFPMRVLLVGPPRARDALRAQVLDSSIDIGGEFASVDDARQSGLAADALLVA